MNKKGILKFTLSGFAMALILVAMLATVFAVFSSDMAEEYNQTINSSVGIYNSSIYNDIQNQTEAAKDATRISQEDSWLDVIGGYFSAGYSALSTAFLSFGWFDTLLDEAVSDVPEFAIFKDFIIYAFIIAIFVGVAVAALVKMRV